MTNPLSTKKKSTKSQEVRRNGTPSRWLYASRWNSATRHAAMPRQLSNTPNRSMFPDFFFVLSGFVIAANYQQRLLDGFGVGRFLLLRLGRLYPLHFTMLALFVGVELLRVLHRVLVPAPSFTNAVGPFTTPEQAPDTTI